MRRDINERFDEKWVDTLVGCHAWSRMVDKDGYGLFKLPDPKLVKAHRWAYERAFGPIPNDLVIDHLCRVRHCVNPDHLEAVTSPVNTMRGVNLATGNLAKTHCPQGHEYSEENTYTYKGGRACRICVRAKCRRWYWDQKK